MPGMEKGDIGNTVPGSNFEGFKERNKENLETLGWRGDQEAAAGLYAEHELLQAVFARGLEIQGAHDKKALVEKLYSQACEMLVGGKVPVEGEEETFTELLKRNPAEAMAQLMPINKKFSFDVLVVEGTQLKEHIVCDMDPSGQNRTYLMDTTSAETAQAMAIGATMHPAGRRTNPSYTQHMAYQTSADAGQFHVFSSQPPSQSGPASVLKNMNTTNASGPTAGPTAGTTAGPTAGMNTTAMPDMAWLQEMNKALDNGLDLGDETFWTGPWEEQVPEMIDLVQNRSALAADASRPAAPASVEPPATHCRLQEDLEYVIGTLGQSEEQLHEQLMTGHRPPILAELYRSQHAMERRGFPSDAVLENMDMQLDDVVRDAYGNEQGLAAVPEPMSPNTMQGMEFIQWPAN